MSLLTNRRWFVGLISFSLIVIVAMTTGTRLLEASELPGDPPGQARWLPFDSSAPGQPALILLGSDAQVIDLKADLPGCMVKEVEVEGQSYTRLYGEGYGFSAAVGLPSLPVLRRDVEIPFGAEVTLELIRAEYTEHTLSGLGLHTIYPVQPPLPKSAGAQGVQGDGAFVIDRDFYARGSSYPAEPLALGQVYVVRGHRVQPVEVWPVAYNPATGELRLYHQLTFRLRLVGSDPVRTGTTSRRYASPAFESQLAHRLLNYNQGGSPEVFGPETQVGYLIITADDYYNAMQPFVTLKQGRGFDVTITTLSQIPGGGTRDNIKAYIQNAYDTWPLPPSYVLLVGDTDTVPTWTGPVIGTSTDLYYGTMDGSSDWHPDIGRGRFPVRSVAHTTIMVNKYLAYAGLTGQEPWLKKAAFIATCDNYTVAEGTHNYVVDAYTDPQGYTGIFPNTPQPGGDKIYCVTYNGAAANTSNAANQGRWAIIYSGHGSQTGWGDGQVSFSQSDVRNLNGQGFFPFVASHACLTGDFGYSAMPEVYGETWVLQDNKGALVYWGSSTYSYWDEDDVLERVMFDSLFAEPSGHVAVAEMTDDGLAAVENAYPDSARYYWETYNILGDPAVKMFLKSDKPDFELAAMPAQLELCTSGAITYTIQVNQILTYPYPVTLELGPLPAGVAAELWPVVVTPTGQAELRLTGMLSAPVGAHAQVITGTAQMTNVHVLNVPYTVNTTPGAAPHLTSPDDGVVIDSLAPVLRWNPAALATSYELQVARDAIFNQVVLTSTGVATTSFQLPGALEPMQEYYWRVRGVNSCGASEYSEARRFETPEWPCVLLVDDDGGKAAQAAYTAALDVLGISYDVHTVASSSANGPEAMGLIQYPIVIWLTGDRYMNTLTAGDRASLKTYLDGGGRLFVSGWGIGSELDGNAFLAEYLHADYTGDGPWGSTEALSGSGFLAGLPVTVTIPLAQPASKLLPLNGAEAVYSLRAPYGSTAVAYTGDYQVVYLGFGLEWVQGDSDRRAVAAAIVDWLGPCAVPPPVPGFTSSSPDVIGTATIFTNTSTGAEPITYTWKWGDGGSVVNQAASQALVTHTYQAVGEYTVWLTATNAGGSVAVSGTVEITGRAPSAGFVSSSPVELGEVMVFTNTSEAGEPEATAYVWAFGDGVTSTLEHPTHTYTIVDTHTLLLTSTTYVVWLRASNLAGEDVVSGTAQVLIPHPPTMYSVYLPVILKQPGSGK